jgi:tRNA U34 5-methylaminomethyl-2-thiouridine-forming methyltransferase MnmC
MTEPDNYELVVTDDGSLSLFSNEVKETMHTHDGAYYEAKFKYVELSKINEQEKKCINVLDVGFGLGYNILALLHEQNNSENDKIYKIVSLEKDRSIEKWFDKIIFNDHRDSEYSKAKSAFRNGRYEDERCSIDVIIGDARNSIIDLIKIKSRFDVVFQDAYSPSKNPELWSLEYFINLKAIMNHEAILTTYSAAPQVRMAMLKAGFTVGAGPSIGKKKEGTIATPGHSILSLTEEYIENLADNVKSTVYRDVQLNGSREKILQNRIEEMARIRLNRQAHQE